MSLLVLLVPSLGFGLAAARGEALLPLLLLYYGGGILWMGLGRALAPWMGRRLGRKQVEGAWALGLALLLPYPLYFLLMGLLRAPVGTAYGAFLRGPGVAVPLTVGLLWPLGVHLPPLLGAGLVALGSLLGERVWRRWALGFRG